VHLYGELVKTEMGAQYLKQTQDIDQFKKLILSEETPLMKKRATLWALGHVGSSPEGLKLIKEAKIIKEIVKMAEQSNILSLRGTCTYILGLLTNTNEGKKEVLRYNWLSSVSNGLSVCLPRDPNALFRINDYQYLGELALQDEIWNKINLVLKNSELTQEEVDIVKLVSNLVNGVTEM